MICSETSSLLGLIHPSEIRLHKIAVTECGNTLPTYRFLREPSTIHELTQFQNGIVVYTENNTLTLINFHNAYPMRLSWPQVQYTKYFFLSFHFDEETSINCLIYGDSTLEILQRAAFFAKLKTLNKLTETTVRFHRDLIFGKSDEAQLGDLFDAMATQKFTFFLSELNNVLSAVMATRPYPLQLSLLLSSMDYNAFVEHLKTRTTSFGSLSVRSLQDENFLRELFGLLHLFQEFHTGVLPNDLLVQLLSAPMEGITCEVKGDEADAIDLTSIDIVSRDIELGAQSKDDLFPSGFVVSYFDRLGELGHLNALGFRFLDATSMSTEVGGALCRVVAACPKLAQLELSYRYTYHGFIEDLFAVLETHPGLRTLRIDGYLNYRYGVRLSPLKRLLRRNRQIDVVNIPDGILRANPELKEICSTNRFFRGSQNVIGKLPSSRLALLGAAMTHNGPSDLQRTGILLNDHVDLLLEMLQDKIVDTDVTEQQ